MSDNKDYLIVWAKLSEQGERFEDMAKSMKELVEDRNDELTNEERTLLSTAYKNVVDARRSSWRVVLDEEAASEDDKKAAMAKEYRMKLGTEITAICNEALSLLEQFLVNTNNDEESKVFYLKMKGDYYRYLAEVELGTEKEEDVEESENAYKDAMNTAEDCMSSTHPNRLNLALNHSLFYYEIKNNQQKAYELAKKAYDEAMSELDSLDQNSYKDSTLIMQLLGDNLTLWSSDSAGDEQEEDN